MGSVDSQKRLDGGLLHGNLVGGRKSTKMKTKGISVHDDHVKNCWYWLCVEMLFDINCQ